MGLASYHCSTPLYWNSITNKFVSGKRFYGREGACLEVKIVVKWYKKDEYISVLSGIDFGNFLSQRLLGGYFSLFQSLCFIQPDFYSFFQLSFYQRNRIVHSNRFFNQTNLKKKKVFHA